MNAVRIEPWKPLTPPEEMMLELLVDGSTVKEIAEKMQIPVRRAIYYNDSLRLKFTVENRRDLIKIARARQEAKGGS